MSKSEKQIAQAADEFSQRWKDKGYEKGESQVFWAELLAEVFGIEHPSNFIHFEDQVKVDATNFIDGHIPDTRVLIEQKSLGTNLLQPQKQSDGKYRTPFQQAKHYIAGLPFSKHPRWVVTCNFAEFLVYDMERPNDKPEQILLANLGKEHYRLRFLVETGNEHLEREMQVSMQAGVIVGKLYDALLKEYKDPTNAESLRSLNVLCVRLVFCLYSEDAGIFGRHDMFHDYLARYATMDMRHALVRLFKVLDTPLDERDPYLQDDLAGFPYVNGGLFSGDIEIPRMNEEIRELLLQHASLDFDWSEISPTIFGAVFESTLNPETRRSGGMHYTSIENIHKVIDPLFLDDLRRELDNILVEPVINKRQLHLKRYQEKLASLTFLDPACGSGNFLTETYLSLRRLENKAIRARYDTETSHIIGAEFVNPILVNIHQFYGIEINDFAVTVAKTALWISESQVLTETEKIIHHNIDFLPLKTYPNIVEGNALRIDWRTLFTVNGLERLNESLPYNQNNAEDNPINPHNPPTIKLPDYIMGNPPFVGQKLQTVSQKADLLCVFGDKHKGLKMLDYVAGWYKKAAEIIQGTHIKAALVSTNSICQGEAIEDLWSYLFSSGIQIDFAHRTFRWDSEASLKAHVHCVIVGFSANNKKGTKTIYDNENVKIAENINGYLIDAPNIVISRRGKPLCQAPDMTKGAQLIDGGGFMLNSEDEMKAFVNQYPEALPFIYRYYNAKDFLNNAPAKYCLYLKHCSPALLKSCKGIYDKVKAVYKYRSESEAKTTRALMDTPWLFFQSQVPENQSIVIPVVSSENRHYIPMCFMPTGNVYTNALFYVDNANLYQFGVLESNVHMAWTRVVCGRLKSDYRYSNDIVYNNFPWPEVNEEQRERIAQTAQGILDARALYPDSSLADLYDPVTMQPELRKAHRDNDRAVMAAYGFSSTLTESEIVARLFTLYSDLIKQS